MSDATAAKLRPIIESDGQRIHARCPLCSMIICGPEAIKEHYNIIATVALAAHLIVCKKASR